MPTTLKKPPVFPYSDADLARMKRESAARHAKEPHATNARFNEKKRLLIIELRDGAAAQVPVDLLGGLEGAADAQIGAVRVVDGRALWWDELDVQMSLIAVLCRAFKLRDLGEVTRRGGSARSPRKAASSRANGAKGGRPRKPKAELVAA